MDTLPVARKVKKRNFVCPLATSSFLSLKVVKTWRKTAATTNGTATEVPFVWQKLPQSSDTPLKPSFIFYSIS